MIQIFIIIIIFILLLSTISGSIFSKGSMNKTYYQVREAAKKVLLFSGPNTKVFTPPPHAA